MFKKQLIGSYLTLPKDVKGIFTTEDYKSLPKELRERNGLYLVPLCLALNLEHLANKTKVSEWDTFYNFIRQEYPIQWFVRHWLTSWDNPVYAFLKIQYMRFVEFKYNAKLFIKPLFPRWRNSCKRHQGKDICTLIIDSNFALILDFWYEEVVNGIVNWQSDLDHKTFYKEIKNAVNYIENDRKKLESKADEELEKATKRKGSYTQKYGKLNKIEEQIRDKDTKILLWFINNRNFFWT